MNNIETMKLALEAFDRMVGRKPEFVEQAITALRQAIEQAQQAEPAPVAKNEGGSIKWLVEDWPQNCFLYAEPPTWTPVEIGVDVTSEGAHVVGMYVLPDAVRYVFYSQLHPAPPRQPEPVIDKSAAIRIATALGWTPPRQPLSVEQLEAMAEAHVTDCYFDTLKYARAIEDAHGIKGEA